MADGPIMILKRFFGKKSNPDDWDLADDILGSDSTSQSVLSETSTAPEDLRQLNEIKARAKIYNDHNFRKLDTIASKLSDMDREIFGVLSSLVHLNVPGLPGFIADRKRAPDGIFNFKAATDLPNLLKSLFPKVNVR